MSITLCETQQRVVDLIESGFNVFMTGMAGSGKSVVIKTLLERNRGYSGFFVSSTTGTSALSIGGKTLHSLLGIGLGKDTIPAMIARIRKNKKKLAVWISARILVIDEVSMLSPTLFDKLEKVAQQIRRSAAPFGGVQLLLSGDFLQLPVVGEKAFCFESDAWKKCIDTTIFLDKNFRQSADPAYAACLSEIRFGEMSATTLEMLESRVGADVSQNGVAPTKLYACNKDVDAENMAELQSIFEKNPKLDLYEYECIIGFIDTKMTRDAAIKTANVPEILQLCVGLQVMMLRNSANPAVKLVNGSRGVIVRFEKMDGVMLPFVRFLSGVETLIKPAEWTIQNESGKTQAVVSQIPLKPAYALSIHKAQGITLDCAIIDLEEVFEENQAYVALSRVSTLAGLSLRNSMDKSKSRVRANKSAILFYKQN